jgi:hypothetical protein
MKTTQHLEDLLKDKGKAITPTPDYMRLKFNIGTFCALLCQFLENDATITRSL